MKRVIASTSILCVLILLAACGASIEKEKVKAEENVKQAFQDKPKEPNQEVQSIKFNLPTGIAIKEETPNNIILENKDEPYILFYNPNEDLESKALYDVAVQIPEQDLVVNKTFTDDHRFGYLVIAKTGDDLYVVTTGIGGIKATAKSKVKTVAEDAKVLMQIVASTEVTKQE